MMDFDAAFDKLIGPSQEGGYANNRADPGGETKYGISHLSYPDVDIKNLTVAQAKVIYKRDFWLPSKADLVPESIRYAYFSLYVNAPPREAVKVLQRAAGVLNQDGVLGPVTLGMAAAMDPIRLQYRFSMTRLLYYTSCHDWPAFGRGWTARECNKVLNG